MYTQSSFFAGMWHTLQSLFQSVATFFLGTQDRRGRVDGWLSWELLVSDLDKDLRILPIHAR